MTSGLLLDTNVLYWAMFRSDYLPSSVRTALRSEAIQCLVSPISTNELAIKANRGKLTFALPVEQWVSELIEDLDAVELPLTNRHAGLVEGLPRHHNDPFDRLIIAQALAEGVAVATSDALFELYGISRVW